MLTISHRSPFQTLFVFGGDGFSFFGAAFLGAAFLALAIIIDLN